ncbi:MAG: DUF4199 domain-containing protein [Flavobacterium sp.]|nr:MAG: DUF4199 domain-containing protein [Flavobacterium sp.]
MRKTVLTYGLIAGCIVSVVMLGSMAFINEMCTSDWGMIIGYTTQIVAFMFIFVAVKKYRDREGKGAISFGKAFTIGLYISLIASTMYVLSWMIDYHFFVPDFMDKYAAASIEKMKAAGASAAELDATAKQMSQYKDLYKNPVLMALFTYVEILPTGLLASLLAAAFLKRKPLNPIEA